MSGLDEDDGGVTLVLLVDRSRDCIMFRFESLLATVSATAVLLYRSWFEGDSYLYPMKLLHTPCVVELLPLIRRFNYHYYSPCCGHM